MPTVLIVEHNRALADAVAEVLRSIGYGTLIAHDGEAALSVVERSEPEVAIVDLELPAIDGLEVARRLREGYGKRIRLIANSLAGQRRDPFQNGRRWLRRRAHQAHIDLPDSQGNSARWRPIGLITVQRRSPATRSGEMLGFHSDITFPAAHCIRAAKSPTLP